MVTLKTGSQLKSITGHSGVVTSEVVVLVVVETDVVVVVVVFVVLILRIFKKLPCVLTLRRPLRRKLLMRWFFDISKVKESSFF